MATVTQIIERAYTKVNGEYEAIIDNSDDFNTYLNILNQGLDAWFETPYVKWQSLYNMNYTLATPVANGLLTYAIANPNTLLLGNSPFDSVYFIDGTGAVVDKYKMTDQPFFDATNDPKVCAWFGDGLHLKATPSNIVGTTICLPMYIKPSYYTTGTQEVMIDSVSWLVCWMAAMIADASPVPFISRSADKYSKEADVYMKGMRANNIQRQHMVIKHPGQVIGGVQFNSLTQAVNSGAGFGVPTSSVSTSVDGGSF